MGCALSCMMPSVRRLALQTCRQSIFAIVSDKAGRRTCHDLMCAAQLNGSARPTADQRKQGNQSEGSILMGPSPPATQM